jgi:hypothetical protein
MFRKVGLRPLQVALLAAFVGTALVAAGPAASSSYTITADGTPLTVTTTSAGENARATFSGTDGQRISLDISEVTIGTSGCCSMEVWIAKPDGTQLFKKTLVGRNGAFLNTKTLPSNGTYKIMLDPQGTAKGSATLKLYTVPNNLDVSATADGSDNAVTIGTPGQNAQFSFSGTAGQRVAVDLPDVMSNAKVSIRKPDGTNLLSPVAVTDGAFLGPKTLPANGTYKVFLDPQGNSTGDATVRVHTVPANLTGTIVPDGPAQTVSLAPGQNATLTFTGTAGQRVSLNMTDVTIANSEVSLVKPDGSKWQLTVNGSEVTPGQAFLDSKNLPANGTYKVVVNPRFGGEGDMTLQLYDVAADVNGGALTIDGASVSLTTTEPGQNGKFTFTVGADTSFALDLSSVTIGSSGCCSAKISIKKPDGSNLLSPSLFGTAGGSWTKTSTVAGTYTIVIDPQNAATGGVTVQLSST